MAQSFKRKRTLCLSFFFPNIFRSPWNTRENFREYSLRLCVKTNVKFAHWVVTPIKTVLTFSNQAFYKLLFIISFLNVLWNYGGKVFLKRLLLNPRTYTQIHTPTEVQGEGGGGGEVVMEPVPRVFDMLQYFETILPSVESLWSSQQDEVYFMGGGATGGLWRHQQCPPSWILPKIRNQVKTARSGIFFCLTYKIAHK